MTDLEKALMHRDGLTEKQAHKARQSAMNELATLLEDGASYEEIEDMMYSDLGLEMDYIFDLI